jgi:hypothetical protein
MHIEDSHSIVKPTHNQNFIEIPVRHKTRYFERRRIVRMSNFEKTKENIEISNKKALFFLNFRWVGVPFLCTGVSLFISVFTTLPDTGDYFLVLLGFGCMALGLTTFGVSHDTAMAIVAEHYPNTSNFDPRTQKELEEDLKWDKAKTLSLKAHVKTAVAIPILAIIIQGYVFTRLSCDLKASFVDVCSWPIF